MVCGSLENTAHPAPLSHRAQSQRWLSERSANPNSHKGRKEGRRVAEAGDRAGTGGCCRGQTESTASDTAPAPEARRLLCSHSNCGHARRCPKGQTPAWAVDVAET